MIKSAKKPHISGMDRFDRISEILKPIIWLALTAWIEWRTRG